MHKLVSIAPLFGTLLLAGCSFGPTTSDVGAGPTLNQPVADQAVQPQIAQPTAVPTTVAATAETTMTDVTSFIDAGVIAKLTAKDKAEAASAQFNALTFGRPGAPRNWAGDNGATGQVTVGPYVRVNNIDCRDFTHSVTIAGGTFSKKGTACRDADGNWAVS